MHPTWRNIDRSFESWAYGNSLLRQIHRLEAQAYLESRRDPKTGERVIGLTDIMAWTRFSRGVECGDKRVFERDTALGVDSAARERSAVLPKRPARAGSETPSASALHKGTMPPLKLEPFEAEEISPHP